MKAIWETTTDTWPNWENLQKSQVNRIYFLALVESEGFAFNSRQLNPDYRRAVEGRPENFHFAAIRDLHWVGEHDPAKVAQAVKTDLESVGAPVPYMIDAEFPFRDPDMLLSLFRRIRAMSPSLLLSWTMEPMQGGWIREAKALVAWINADVNFVVVPQTFYSLMQPERLEAVRVNMEATGITRRRIRLMYDAAKPRPAIWDGCLFHTGRLLPG